MNILHTCAAFSADALLLGWSGLNVAEVHASSVLATKDLGFPVIDTTVTFNRMAEHTYRVQYSTPPLSFDHLILYTGFYFCFFFLNEPAPPEISTFPLPDALPT